MKKLTIIILSLFIGSNVLSAQNCNLWGLKLQSQSEIDSFPINYPNYHDIEGSLSICGEDIVNLDGLAQIKSVEEALRIQNTSLLNLSGFDSLSSVGSRLEISGNAQLVNLLALKNLEEIGKYLTIRNNNNLSLLKGLHNFDFTSHLANIIIADCPQLESCKIENLCQFLSNYAFYAIENNGEGCKSRDKIVETCALPLDQSPRIECFYDGFEDWTDWGFPENWSGGLSFYDGQYNVERMPSLVEGDFALTLRSNIPGFEGNEVTTIEMDLEGENELVDISFTYQCLGEGRCLLNLGQKSVNSSGSNNRNIWNVLAGDTSQHSILLQNIEINAPFDYFSYVRLGAHPIFTAVGSYGVSEFIIDDFLITKKEPTATIEVMEKEKVKIYPNPVATNLVIETTQSYETMTIYNYLGQIVEILKFDNRIDVSHLNSGIYVLVLTTKNSKICQKFIKD